MTGEVTGEKVTLGEWGEGLLLRSDGRHCLRGCNGDVVQLAPDQWDEVGRRLARWIVRAQPAESPRPSTSP